MQNVLEDYFAALERLKSNRPLVVPKNTRITNDAVAIEAGRGKGSIKKSRPLYAALLKAIAESAQVEEKLPNDLEKKLKQAKQDMQKYRLWYEGALGRELSFIHQIYELQKELNKLKSATGNLSPLRS